MGPPASRTTSALTALSAGEKAIVLDELLDVRPDLRELAETHAARLMSHEDRSAIAGDEILDGALDPFLVDLERRAALGMRTAAVELAMGILLGLYTCRDGGSETLLEYAPDFAVERAAQVLDQCSKLGIGLPSAELLDLLPEWRAMLGRGPVPHS